MFSQTTQYALRAVVLLAQDPGVPMKTHVISEIAKIPPDYLCKVLQALARAGIVKATRGVNGGFVLARPAGELTPLDVMNAIDPIRRIHKCPLGLLEHQDQLCTLHSHMDSAMATVEKALSAVSIEGLLEGSPQSRPMCSCRKKH